jgi:hypothetical protein
VELDRSESSDAARAALRTGTLSIWRKQSLTASGVTVYVDIDGEERAALLGGQITSLPLPAGRHRLTRRASGYPDRTFTVMIPWGDTLHVVVSLSWWDGLNLEQ